MSKTVFNRLLPLVCAAFVGALAFVPFVFLAVSSVARDWRFPLVLPASFDLRAWRYLFESNSGVAAAVAQSVLIAIATASLAVAVALPAARAIALREFKFKKPVLFALLLPMLAPSFAVATGSHAILLRANLTDTSAGVILAHLVPTAPYAVLLLTASFASFDADFEAQARTLGANNWNVLRFITFPAVAPGLAVAWAFAFLISWAQYLPTLFVGGGQIQTLPLILINFQRGGDAAVTTALTLVFVLPALFVFAVVTRFLRDEN